MVIVRMNENIVVLVKARSASIFNTSIDAESDCNLLGTIGAELFRDVKANGTARITINKLNCIIKTHEDIFVLFDNFIFELESNRQILIIHLLRELLRR